MSEFEQNWLGLGRFRGTFVCYLDTIVTAVRRQTLSIAGIVAD